MVELAGTVEEETEGGVVVEMPEGTNVGAKAARFRRSATVASPSLGGGDCRRMERDDRKVVGRP